MIKKRRSRIQLGRVEVKQIADVFYLTISGKSPKAKSWANQQEIIIETDPYMIPIIVKRLKEAIVTFEKEHLERIQRLKKPFLTGIEENQGPNQF